MTHVRVLSAPNVLVLSLSDAANMELDRAALEHDLTGPEFAQHALEHALGMCDEDDDGPHDEKDAIARR